MSDDKQKAPTPKSIFPGLEKEVLAFWDKENIFQKTLDQTKGGKPFVFFEGPPTANGKPGIHHVLARAYKDVIARYKTMRGFYVERKAGWDTHGLPVEIQVEKELGISGKPEIEKFGIEAFNKKCRESVWKYKADLEEMTRKIGFWLDMEHPYVTYENNYIESLWWVIKQIWDKGYLYKGFKVVPHCPRCGTALSSHEVALGYKSVEENSVFIKFKVVGQENTYIVSWTTTPWTLPGNVALAVGKNIKYQKLKVKDEIFIAAEAVAEKLFPAAEVIETLPGEQLVGVEYEPLFDIKPLKKETAYKVYAADFVNTEEGTGVVHTAVMYGEDDYWLGEKVGLPKHHTVDLNGNFTADVSKWAGKFVKDKEVEKGIVADLRERGLLLKEEMYTHDYPFCWRCGTPLLYYAKDSWFIAVTKVKEQLIKNNENINWVPGYIKHGRFGEWLNEVKDWAFSRERYWGTPLPVWECEKCEKRECIGSIEELHKKSPPKADQPPAEKIKDKKSTLDLHRPYVDEIKLKCDCGGTMHRVRDVVDVWFDSGAMPFAQWHYPFENKERIDAGVSFPADFIAEGIDQTRGWFYTLLTVATLLGYGTPYKNVICLNLVFDAKGQKMSKSKGNIVDPFYIIDKYGADTLRWFLFTVNQPGDAKLFDEKQLDEVVKKQWLILWNILSFWKMYAYRTDKSDGGVFSEPRSAHILDKWILAKTHDVVSQVTNNLEKYNVTDSGRLIAELINELSTWYVRRSRNRFKQDGQDKQDALAVLRFTLVTIARLSAPLAPFMAEALYREVKTPNEPESVHLADWPVSATTAEGAVILKQMAMVRQAVELGHSLRKEKQIKVRQPLPQFIIRGQSLDPMLKDLVKDEVNVKEVITVEKMPQGPEFAVKEAGQLAVALDMTITDELKYEGMVREMVRQINAMRKTAKLTIGDTVALYYEITDPELEKIFLHYKNTITHDVIASVCLKGLPDNVDLKTVFEIAGAKVAFGIKGK